MLTGKPAYNQICGRVRCGLCSSVGRFYIGVSIFLLVVVCLMRVLKERGDYLRRKAKSRFLLFLSCVAILALMVLTSFKPFPFYIDVGEYDVPRGLLMVFPLFFGLRWWRQYRGYKSGLEGEREVTELLKSGLSDDCCLINDVTLKDGYGNIDHVVLSPRGVFVIETKNWKGKVSCYSDNWSTGMGSPSRQVRINACRIRKIILSLRQFRGERIWVEPVVVFSNPDVKLDLKNVTVEVKKLNEILYYFINYEGKRHFSPEDLELMGKEILRQTC